MLQYYPMRQIPILFLQSEIKDPYIHYESMLRENPVYFDPATNLWAIHSYEDCSLALSHISTNIPGINTEGLNEYAQLISGKLARLTNGAAHELARHAAYQLFENINPVSAGNITAKLLQSLKSDKEVDWVNTVCLKLPSLVLLNSFGFAEEDVEFISAQVSHLSKLIAPVKTSEQIDAINGISKEVYDRIEKHIAKKNGIKINDTLSLCVSNLIGLLIQGYDAGRGLLSNSLLQLLNGSAYLPDTVTLDYLQKLVMETLRFDPPVHHTRRIVTEDIILGNSIIRKGEMLLIVLAAANRDPKRFGHPSIFNIDRGNNSDHLTFGRGIHKCLANHYSVSMVTGSLYWLLNTYKRINFAETNIDYEPLANVRFPKNIFISLTQ